MPPKGELVDILRSDRFFSPKGITQVGSAAARTTQKGGPAVSFFSVFYLFTRFVSGVLLVNWLVYASFGLSLPLSLSASQFLSATVDCIAVAEGRVMGDFMG